MSLYIIKFGEKMNKIIPLIFLSLLLVGCDFTTSKNPETSWIKSVKGKTFSEDDGTNAISLRFDENGNYSLKITGDNSNDLLVEFEKFAAQSFQYIYVKAIDKNRAIYSIKIFSIAAYFGLKLEKNKLFMTATEPAETPEDVNWDELEYIASKK